jgi:uncharacterized SAM-binding protein YcdF (DUF218 family)
VDLGVTFYALAKALLLPPASLLFAGAVGLALWKRWPRAGRLVAGGAWLLLFVLSLPLVAASLEAAVGTDVTVDAAALRTAQAIVIPGGGLRLEAREFDGDTLGVLTLERTRYGARLARETGLPVLVTGGRPPRATRAEGDLMREALEREYGVAVRWVENASRNTRENALNAAAILLPQGVRRIAVVLHAVDVRRATAEYRAAGFDVIAAPTHLPRVRLVSVLDLLPSASGLYGSYYALYELAGLVVQRLR